MMRSFYMNPFHKTHLMASAGGLPNEPSLIDAIALEVAKMEKEDGASEAEPDKKPRYLCADALPWRNRNYEVLSQLMNTLCMSESQAALMLTAVNALMQITIATTNSTSFVADRKLDDSSPLPPSVASIRQEELRVLENSKIRIRTFNEDPAVPVPVTPKTNILMISPNQDVKCMAYDVWTLLKIY